MTLHIYNDVEQGTERWHDLRRGIITASTVGQLLEVGTLGAESFECPTCLAQPDDPCKTVAKGRTGPLKTMHTHRVEAAREAGIQTVRAARTDDSNRLTLLLVSERIAGISDDYEQFMSRDMERGVLDEPLAREVYAKHFAEGAPVETVGFLIRDDWGFPIGASPDGLVGDHGGLEVKCPRMKEHVRTILADEVPTKYMPQIQASLLVSGREYWDFMSFWGGLPPFVKRVYPSAKWADAIVDAVSAFEQRAEEMMHGYFERTAGLPDTEPRVELEMSL